MSCICFETLLYQHETHPSRFDRFSRSIARDFILGVLGGQFSFQLIRGCSQIVVDLNQQLNPPIIAPCAAAWLVAPAGHPLQRLRQSMCVLS